MQIRAAQCDTGLPGKRGLAFSQANPIHCLHLKGYIQRATDDQMQPIVVFFTIIIMLLLQLLLHERLMFLSLLGKVSLKVFFGKPGPWFEDCDLDGDKTSIFHDLDGSVTEYKDTYVGRMDNYLIQHPNCVSVSKWNGVVCSGTYAQVRGYVIECVFRNK